MDPTDSDDRRQARHVDTGVSRPIQEGAHGSPISITQDRFFIVGAPIAQQSIGQADHGDARTGGEGPINLQPQPEKKLLPQPTKGAPVDDTEILRGIGQGAEVWTTYVKETREYDDENVDGWNRSLDVTLVFVRISIAALFSAILTAFVLESVKSLQPDPSEITATTLVEMSQILRGIATGQSPVELPEASSPFDFHPTQNAVWVNCLWFFSLSLSVAVSLAAMLAKQWCYYFLAGRTGDAITQAEERQKRFNGIAKWRMRGVLELLPILMHLSLAVFAIGLVLYLWDINVAAATTVTTVVALTTCFYVGTTLLPVKWEFCPFKTPQVEYIKATIKAIRGLPKKLSHWKRELPPRITYWAQRTKGWALDTGRRYFLALGRLSKHFPRDHEISDLDNRSTSGHGLGLIPGIAFPTVSRRPAPSNRTPNTSSQRTAGSSSSAVDDNKQIGPFVEDSLLWLIKHSQKSLSIDTAIGALAIGKVPIRAALGDQGALDLKERIHSHLVKHFLDCFKSQRAYGVKVYALEDRSRLAALDYSRWMSHFAGSTMGGIMNQTLEFHKTFGVNLPTQLGLAFSSLGEIKNLSPSDGANIAMWLSAFINLYDSENLYFSERVVSVIIDGLTSVSVKCGAIINPDRDEYATNFAVPKLVEILWKVSHLDNSRLRSSIGLNLAIFALKAKLHYPFDKGFDTSAAADRIFAEYRSGKVSLQDAGFAPFAIFSLLGLIHPESNLRSLDGTVNTIISLIRETHFFFSIQYQTGPLNISRMIHVDPTDFRRHVATMFVETMISMLALGGANAPTDHGPKWELQTTGFWPQDKRVSVLAEYWGGHTFPSTLHAICHLIYDHLHEEIEIYPEVIAATAELLLREVGELSGLDTSIFDVALHGDLVPFEEAGERSSHQGDITLRVEPVPEDTEVASSTLALIISRSTDKQCIETAVRAVLRHSSDCEVSLVLQAVKWFANNVETVGAANQDHLLSVSGYARILTSMVMHCVDPDGLVKSLDESVDNPDGGIHDVTLESVGQVMTSLAETSQDAHVRAFGVAGLAVWTIYSTGFEVDHPNILDQLATTWSLLGSSSKGKLRPEALEALLDTTVLIAASTQLSPDVWPENIRLAITLLAQFQSESEAHVRPALAVAVAFWGLSCEEAGHEWEFWVPETRREYWRRYSRLKARTEDLAALFLLGLSRILAHCSQLLLSHSNIKTIAFEINRYMRARSTDPKITLQFISEEFDVRRHVRESVREYLQKTEKDGPFTKSDSESRNQLLSAITLGGGEGYEYERPQPFARRAKNQLMTESTLATGDRPGLESVHESMMSSTSGMTTQLLGESSA